ncbi:MAG: glycoside hydrolase family 65 protein [Eubacterium sp.]|nr:glycoside hydrolase family 65 protein [Eubacterium sp.]
MINWKIRKDGFDYNKIAELGNRFLIGNGYMGVRGTLEEFEKEQLVAVNLAGIYDQVGDSWREPLNAPNGFFGYLEIDGKPYRLPEEEPKSHSVELDYRHGIFKRETVFKTGRGEVTLVCERFVSMEQIHVGAMRFTIRANFHADINLITGIDSDVWDINGPHYKKVSMDEESMLNITATSEEKEYQVSVVADEKTDFPCEKKLYQERMKSLRIVSFITDIDREYCVEKFFAVYTSKDTKDCYKAAKEAVSRALNQGYEAMLSEQKESWEKLWEDAEVLIDGDDRSMEALNYSEYHLMSIAPRHAESMSIAARGLSGQTYKGAVFWDTEMFMLDFFLMTNPAVAKTLMRYRIDTLDGAKKKAKEYGYQGAFYAWESQEGGFDACSDYNVTDVFTKRPMRTFFRDKQVHISAAVVYGICRYVDFTKDDSILIEGGAETIIECGKFYYDLLQQKVGSEKYEIHDVIGPDEYHERVNNNGYTNRMAKFTFQAAVELIKKAKSEPERFLKNMDQAEMEQLEKAFQDAYEKIYIPMPNEQRIIPQFDGYFDLEDTTVEEVRSRLLSPKEYWGGAYGVASHTQIIKQADVVTWLSLFPQDVTENTLLANWKYYEPRTEHGSSLSACMYAMLACRCNMPEKAFPLFLKSASADLQGGGKEWAGLVYIGGTHPAAAGGAYMVALRGFAGLRFENHQVTVKPNLPAHWKGMKFRVCYENEKYEIEISQEQVSVQKIRSLS